MGRLLNSSAVPLGSEVPLRLGLGVPQMGSPHKMVLMNEHPPATPAVTESDIHQLSTQLGRPPRGVLEIAARCRCGAPTVVKTAPRLDDGTPFPTLYYLTHPEAVAGASRLEAAGAMREMSERLIADPDLRDSYSAAHERYLAQRQAIADVPEIAGISAGGMPERVKCLHVLVAHSLAAGPGVNPLGDEALAAFADQWSPQTCSCGGTRDEADDQLSNVGGDR